MFNKIPFHRILALFTLFCVSLTACAPAPVPTPTATMPVETPTPSATATASPTPTETPTPTEAPVPQYEISTLPEFKDLGIPVYEIPAADHFNGNLQAFLDTKSQPFDESKVKNIPLSASNNRDRVTYEYEDIKLNFPDPDMKPYRLDVVAGHTVSGIFEYIVLPVEYHSVRTPGKSVWIDTTFIYAINSGPHKFRYSAEKLKYYVEKWISNGRPYFNFSIRWTDDWVKQDLVYKSQHLYPYPILENAEDNYIKSGDPTDNIGKLGMIFDTVVITKTTTSP